MHTLISNHMKSETETERRSLVALQIFKGEHLFLTKIIVISLSYVSFS